jgi:hypothetical protein
MTKTDLFKQFVENRQFEAVCTNHNSEYCGPAFIYYDQDGAILTHIAIVPQTGLFNWIGIDEEIMDPCLGKVEAFAWKYFAQFEYEYKVNVYHKGDKYGN